MDLYLKLKELISQTVSDLYLSDFPDVKKVLETFVIEHPEKENFGDYATNVAMLLAKVVKQSPINIANELCYRIEAGVKEPGFITEGVQVFDKVSVAAPGFINLSISKEWLKILPGHINKLKAHYGDVIQPEFYRIALEHSNVNPNKAAHIGHLRNACIGQFVERAYEKLGFSVEVQYYANNVGVQVATSAMGLEKIKTVSPASYKKFDHYAWDVYASMESQINASTELQNERLNLLKKLEDFNSPEFIRQKELADKILLEQIRTFSNLGFDYDIVIYESDILAKKLWETAFLKLKTNPNVYYATEGKSAGCWLVRLDTESKATEVPSTEGTVAEDDDIEKDKIIVRSNGVPTYTGKDIAYHMWKYGLLDQDFDYNIWHTGTQSKPLYITDSLSGKAHENVTFKGVDYVFDVIGVEQSYAMEVVRKSLEFLGFKMQAQRMKHINYGFVFLSKSTAEKLGIDVSDNRKFYAMSGRKGWGIKIDDLIAMVDSKLKEDHGDFQAVEAVRNAAIKFQMLKLNTFQDLIFDLDEALDLKGFSGPYIQYAYVRANSIISKANAAGISMDTIEKTPAYDSSLNLESAEEMLLRHLYKFPEVLEESAKSFAPNLMCNFLFELAKRFNTLYNDLPILSNSNEKIKLARLSLCNSVKIVLQQGLFVLGIDAPEKM